MQTNQEADFVGGRLERTWERVKAAANFMLINSFLANYYCIQPNKKCIKPYLVVYFVLFELYKLSFETWFLFQINIIF